MKSRFEKARKTLIFWTLFIGLGAVGGAACMLIDPSGKALGMDAMLPFFQKMPLAELLFQDFVFSGISLLIVNGLTNLTAAVLLLRRKHAGVVLGGVFGVTLMLWICIQFWLFPLNFMSTLYFFFGLAQALTGYAAWVFERQENFTVRREDYPHIGANPKRLVVYFSRMGYVRRKAFEEAERTGAEVYEIKAAERTEGTLGHAHSAGDGRPDRLRARDPLFAYLGVYAGRAGTGFLSGSRREDSGGGLRAGSL